MKKVFIFLLILVGISVGIIAIQKAFAPKVTKVEYTLEDAKAFETKIGTSSSLSSLESAVEPKDSVKNSGVKSVNTKLSEKEATALINMWAEYWQYAPLLNSNVKINPDNTVEYSGTFDLNRAIGYANVTGVSKEIVDVVKKYIQPFGASFPIYAKGTVDIKDNVVNGSISDARISIVPVTSVVNKYAGEINSFVSDRLSTDSTYGVKSLNVSDGNLNVEGSFPEKVEFYKGK